MVHESLVRKEVCMLPGARVQAVVPVSDLGRSIEFFTQKVGLDPPVLDEIPGTPGATFTVGGGVLYLYESVGAGQSRHTVAGFMVDDVEQAVPSVPHGSKIRTETS
jgi:hypothetical protein